MEEERKIKCDCGQILIEKKADFDNFKTKAMVCPKCNFITLTRDQAREYIKLKRLHDIIDKESKIIKIGNSMGITLPEELKEFDIKIGKKVKLKALDTKTILIEI
ncbi:hypothetical protein J4216_04285 [Candidatus Woesearchaeota archaeon]|nr:hypothetical protein [Candidatus Woesearchaeota archaeon]